MRKVTILLTLLMALLSADGFETIKKKDYPNNWAFTVDKVKIGCEMQLPVVFVDGDNMAYGLTGYSAKAVGKSIDAIWADNEKMKGLKMDLSIFIDKALSHCSN